MNKTHSTKRHRSFAPLLLGTTDQPKEGGTPSMVTTNDSSPVSLILGAVLFGLIFAQATIGQTDTNQPPSDGVQMTITSPTRQVMLGKLGTQPFKVPAPVARKGQKSASATFTIQYLNTGDANAFGDVCVGWPADANVAFTYAANIWGSLINSSVPRSEEHTSELQ